MGMIKDIVVQHVYEERHGVWVALVQHREHDYRCGGTGGTAEEAINRAVSCFVDMLCMRGRFTGVRPHGPRLADEQWKALQIACCHYENETTFGESAPAWRALDSLRMQAGMGPAPREWPATDTREAYPIYDEHIKPLSPDPKSER